MNRPNQRSTARWNPRSQPGARGREELGRLSGPGLFIFAQKLFTLITRDTRAAATLLKYTRNVSNTSTNWLSLYHNGSGCKGHLQSLRGRCWPRSQALRRYRAPAMSAAQWAEHAWHAWIVEWEWKSTMGVSSGRSMHAALVHPHYVL